MISEKFCAKEKAPSRELPEIKQVVSLTDLTPDVLRELVAGDMSDVAVVCEKGVELPFKYTGNFGLFSVKYNPELSLKMEETCYFRLVKYTKKNGSERVTGYISFDTKSWTKIKKFEIDPNILFGMSADKTHVAIETNFKPTFEETN